MNKLLRFKSLFFILITLCLVVVWEVLLGKPSVSQTLPQAQAQIAGPEINGTLFLKQQDDGSVRIWGQIQGNPQILTPGLHGLHIHSAGVCEPDASPAFSSAGGHYDPGPYGNETPVENNHPYHLGDLPNLVVNDVGYAVYNVVTSRISLGKSPVSVFDENGSAIIVHRFPDQQKAGGTGTETGGPRLACGVVTSL